MAIISPRITKTPGGNSLIIGHDPETLEFNFSTVVNVGAFNETEGIRGISHMIEHMVFHGTTTRSKTDISNGIDNNGGSMNAFTSDNITKYYASGHIDSFDHIAEAIIDISSNAIMNPEAFDNERNVVLQELSMYDVNPSHKHYELYETHVRGNHPIIGYVDDLNSMTPDVLLEYYQQYYTQNRKTYIAMGNMTDEKIERLMDLIDEIGGENDSTAYYHPLKEKPYECKGNITVVNPAEQERHRIITQLPFPVGENYTDEFARSNLFSRFMSGSFSSPIFRILRDENGYCYSANLILGDNNFKAITFMSDTTKENVQPMIDAVLEILSNFDVHHETTPMLLDGTKKKMEIATNKQFKSITSMDSVVTNAIKFGVDVEKIDYDKSIELIRNVTPDHLGELSKHCASVISEATTFVSIPEKDFG